MEIVAQLYNFLKSDRQWKRIGRIDHARRQWREAKTPQDIVFWDAVLKANGASITKT